MILWLLFVRAVCTCQASWVFGFAMWSNFENLMCSLWNCWVQSSSKYSKYSKCYCFQCGPFTLTLCIVLFAVQTLQPYSTLLQSLNMFLMVFLGISREATAGHCVCVEFRCSSSWKSCFRSHEVLNQGSDNFFGSSKKRERSV